jgi:hypothetical protein
VQDSNYMILDWLLHLMVGSLYFSTDALLQDSQ